MEQLALAHVVRLAQSEERALWQRAPLRAFEMFLRQYRYRPLTPKEREKPLPKRHYAAETQRTYLAIFGQFLTFLHERELDLVHANERHVAAFLDALPGRQDGKASLVTRRRAFNLIEHAFSELARLQLRRDNPAQALARIAPAYLPAESSAPSSVLLPSQHARLLGYIDALPRDSFEGARRAALLAVAIGCGVTGEELRRLRVEQLALDEPVPLLKMPAHGLRTDVSLPLAEHTLRILREWLQLRASAGAGGALLFPAERDRDAPISLQSLHRYTVAALKAAGHAAHRKGAQRVLRASFAVRQLEQRDDEQVRRWLRLRTSKMIERHKRHVVRADERIV